MCEYCRCRDVPEIARLGAEHDLIEELADEAIRSARVGDAAAAVDRLREAIGPHVQREESGLFVEARLSGLAAEYVDDLEDDHRRFAVALEDPAGLDTAALQRVVDDLRRHIAVEEYDLFPAAAQILDAEQWSRIEASFDADARA